MSTEREALAAWVGREILPHERDLRVWLCRRFVSTVEVEDIVQECYCRLAQLDTIDGIANPRAYLFTIARNLAQQQRKRAAVVRLEPMNDAALFAGDDAPGPERIAESRQELQRLQTALDKLSERARRIFIMRKVEGLSQKQIAAALGISEMVVENDASRGLRAVLRQLTAPTETVEPTKTEKPRARSR